MKHALPLTLCSVEKVPAKLSSEPLLRIKCMDVEAVKDITMGADTVVRYDRHHRLLGQFSLFWKRDYSLNQFFGWVEWESPPLNAILSFHYSLIC